MVVIGNLISHWYKITKVCKTHLYKYLKQWKRGHPLLPLEDSFNVRKFGCSTPCVHAAAAFRCCRSESAAAAPSPPCGVAPLKSIQISDFLPADELQLVLTDVKETRRNHLLHRRGVFSS